MSLILCGFALTSAAGLAVFNEIRRAKTQSQA